MDKYLLQRDQDTKLSTHEYLDV